MWFNTLESPPLPNLINKTHIKDLNLVYSASLVLSRIGREFFYLLRMKKLKQC